MNSQPTELQQKAAEIAAKYEKLPIRERIDIIAQSFGCTTGRIETSPCTGKWRGTSDISIRFDNGFSLFIGNNRTPQAKTAKIQNECVNSALVRYNPDIIKITKEAALDALRGREAKDNQIAAQKGLPPYTLLNVEFNDGTDEKSSGHMGWYYVTLAVDGKIHAHMETGLNYDIRNGKVSENPTRENYFAAGALNESDVDYVFNNVGFSSTSGLYSLPLRDDVLERAEKTLVERGGVQTSESLKDKTGKEGGNLMEKQKLPLEERYIEAWEGFYKECLEKGVKPEEVKTADKNVKVGMYLALYGDEAFAVFKDSMSETDKHGNRKFDYNKLNAVGKEVYSSLNYIQNAKDRDKRLAEGVEKLMDGEEYKDFLKFNSRFHNYSFNNTLLIFIQKPDATRVAGLGTWKKNFGASGINQGEKGIAIARPNIREFEDLDKLNEYMNDPRHSAYFNELGKDRLRQTLETNGSVKLTTSFSYTHVWDISQLHDKDGKPLKLDVPQIRKQIGKDYENYDTVKEALLAVSPVEIRYCKDISEDSYLGHAYGYYNSQTDKITVRDVGFTMHGEKRSEQDCIKTTIHEIAHSMLHGEEMRVEGVQYSSALDKSQKEIEAESVAYMVCDYLGIDSSCNTFGYLASYMPQDAEERYKALEKSMNRITECADTIIEKLDKELERIAAEKKAEVNMIPADKGIELLETISMLGSLQDIVYDLMEGIDMDAALDLYDALNDSVELLSVLLENAENNDLDYDVLTQNLAEILYTVEDATGAATPDYIDALDDMFSYRDVMKQAQEFCDTREPADIDR